MVRRHALRSVLAGAAAVLVLVSLPAEAQWKWKDKSGHVQYSDLPPPPGTPDQDVLTRPGNQRKLAQPVAPASLASAPAVAVAGSGALTPKMVDPELEAKRKKAEADQAAKTKADEEKTASVKADNCTRARSQLQTLESGTRLMRANDKGEREYLDDRQRADETKHAREAISSNCK